MNDVAKELRTHFKGVLINTENFNYELAQKKISCSYCDCVSFGRLAINNPDLPERFRNGWEINTAFDASTWYGGGEKGYLEYKTYFDEKKK